ncbi:GNVR domain-containing protein [Nevskia sp.]|uniref:GNVR domain-containing protein n=1 Tax=Nevskia sp. TaxID=1929292 RepID=UPI0025D88721|nr:GNVR domain-containing protein [Nevskia sp.]
MTHDNASPLHQPRRPLPGDEDIRPRDIYELLIAGRWTLLGVTATVFLLALAYCLLVPPTYRASALIQVVEPTKSGGPVDNRFGRLGALLSGTPSQASAEISLMQSRRVIDPVIAQLHLDIATGPRHFPIVGSGIARNINGNGEAAKPVEAWFGFRRWAWGGDRISVEKLEVPAEDNDSTLILVALEGGAYRLQSFWFGRELLTGKVGSEAASRDGRYKMLVKSLQALPGTEFSVTKLTPDVAVANLIEGLTVEETAVSSGVIEVAYKGSGRAMVARIVDALVESHHAEHSAALREDSERSLEFLNKQLPTIAAQLQEAQAALSKYQQINGGLSVDFDGQLLLRNGVDLESKRLELLTQIDKEKTRYTAEHPVIQALAAQLATIEREQRSLKGRVDLLPQTKQDVLTLTRDVEARENLYKSMVSSIQSYELAKVGSVGNVRTIDSASLPYVPAAPKTLLILVISLALGLLFGVVAVFLRRSLTRGLESPAELATVGLTTLALVPLSKAQRRPSTGLLARLKKAKPASKRAEPGTGLLADRLPEDAAVEALRALRTSLLNRAAGKSGVVVLVSGPVAGSGASFVAANLALLLSQAGRKVVAVDADLRSQSLSRSFGGETSGSLAGAGIVEYVQSAMAPEALLRSRPALAGTVGSLDWISGGGPSRVPADTLLQPRFTDLIRLLAGNYDFVVLDAAPVLTAADAAILGRLAAMTLLVLKSGEHRADELEAALARFADAGVTVQGAVLNQVGVRAGAYGQALKAAYA